MADTNPDDLEKTLVETIGSADTDGLERTLPDDAPPHPTSNAHPTSASPNLNRSIEQEAISLPGKNQSPKQEKRYDITSELGAGAIGEVFAATDKNFNRSVAIKFLSKQHKENTKKERRFIEEAQITASLEHPGIPPVHDLGVTKGGDYFYSMRRLQGSSLADHINTWKTSGTPTDAIDGYFNRARIILRVCETLAFAHSKGVVHQDIKPDNILLGKFGEVVVLDWGTAISMADDSHEQGNMRGTPLYMAPEQARGEKPDARTDVYALGGTLYRLLCLAYPTMASDVDEFWQKKKRGDIDPLTNEQRRDVPRRLLAVANKALSASPADRYQSVEDMAKDLNAFIVGEPMAACSDTPLEWLGRLVRKHRRTIGPFAALLAVLAVLGFTLYDEYQKELSSWNVLYFEDFEKVSPQTLSKHWRIAELPAFQFSEEKVFNWQDQDIWKVSDGTLSSRYYLGSTNLIYNSPIHQDVRVSWETTSLDRAKNYNAFIAGTHRNNGYTFHIGGWDIASYCVLTKKGKIIDVFVKPGGFAREKKHAFVMERSGRRIRLIINGETIFDIEDMAMLSGPDHTTFGLEVADNKLVIDNIQIATKPLPLRVAPLKVGEAFLSRGDYKNALTEFVKIRQAYPGTPESIEAKLQEIMCRLAMKDFNGAIRGAKNWREQNPNHPLTPHAIFAEGKAWFEKKAYKQARELLWQLHDAPSNLRFSAFELFEQMFIKDYSQGSFDVAVYEWDFEALEKIRQTIQSYGDRFQVTLINNETMLKCSFAFNNSGQHDYVLEHFPEQQRPCITALLYRAEWDTLISKYHYEKDRVSETLINAGRLDQVTEKNSSWSFLIQKALLQQDWAAAQKYIGDDTYLQSVLLFNQNKIEESLALNRAHVEDGHLALGKYDELIARKDTNSIAYWLAHIYKGQHHDVAKKFGDRKHYWYITLAPHYSHIVSMIANAAVALDHFKASHFEKANATLDTFDSPKVSKEQDLSFYFTRYIIPALIKSQFDENMFKEKMRTIARQNEYTSKKYVFNIAGYLAGAKTEQDFLNQPWQEKQFQLKSDLELLKGMKADLSGNATLAKKHYQAFQATPWPHKAMDPNRDTFVAWRISKL